MFNTCVHRCSLSLSLSLGRPDVDQQHGAIYRFKMTEREGEQAKMTESESNGIYAESQRKTDETSTAVVEQAQELSLTDHLNKRLLGSFLHRLNESQPDASVSSANHNPDFEDDKPQTD